MCVLFAVRKRHWARESVWFMRRESRSGEREGEAHEEERDTGLVRIITCEGITHIYAKIKMSSGLGSGLIYTSCAYVRSFTSDMPHHRY